MYIYSLKRTLLLSLTFVSFCCAATDSNALKTIVESPAKPQAVEAVTYLKSKKELDEALTQTGPKVFKCSATWCGPCKTIQKDIDKLAEEHKGVVRVYVVDGDNSDFMSFMKDHRVRYYPTLIFLPSGKQLTGVQPYECYARAFKEAAQTAAPQK